MTDKGSKADRYTDEYFASAGVALGQLDRAMQGYRSLAVDVIGLSVRGPAERGGEFLVTIRGIDGEGARVVAFQSATSLVEAIRGLEARLANGTLAWKADQFSR